MKRLGRHLCALVALACVQLAGCERASGPTPPQRIFLITVDTLRADHLGAYGYDRATSPSIDRLSGESVRFDRAISQWPLTGPSFASIMSGLYPRATGRKGQPHVSPPDNVELISEFLRGEGYTTVAVVSNMVLSRRAGWDRGFDEYLETWSGADADLEDPIELKSWLTAARVNDLVLPLFERHRDAEKLFAWIHYSDPHTPYSLPENFDNPFVSNDSTPVPRRLSKSITLTGFETVGDYVANYDANVMIADEGVDIALDRAAELGLMEDALVIFTADHGESLGERDYFFRHGRFPYNASTRVPLIIHDPKRFVAGAVVGEPVELIDLYPTLRELVTPGEPGEPTPGSSLVPTLRGEAKPRGAAFVESRRNEAMLFGVQSRDWKLVTTVRRKPDGEQHISEELYRMPDDLGEMQDLLDAHPGEALTLRRLLGEWMERIGEAPDAESPEVDEQMRKALQALGYLD